MAAGVVRNTVFGYENNKREPTADVLRALAAVLETTTDYLLGLSDVPECNCRVPDEIARLTQKQRDTLRNCDDVIIISKTELLAQIGKALD